MSAGHAEALLLDLCFVMLPLVGAIAGYLRMLRKSARKLRRNFIAAFESRELAQSKLNPKLVYLVLDAGREMRRRCDL